MKTPRYLMRPRNDHGFTMVELIVTLTVFSIMLLAAIPALQNANETQRLRSSVSQVESAMRRARSIAATKRIPTRVTIDVDRQLCILETDSDNDGSFDAKVGEYELSDTILISEVSFDGSTSITFDNRGAPDNPGSVILRARTGEARELMVSAGSGSVTILKVEPYDGG